MILTSASMFLLDIIKGTSVRKWFKFFGNTFSWDVDQVREYQMQRLIALIGHAVSTVPYYTRSIKEINLKRDTLADILNDFPILDREAIQSNHKDLISSKYDMNKLIKGSSSGTTGIPISYYMDKESESTGNAAGYALWRMSGWNFGQKAIHIWGNQTSVARWNTLQSRLKNSLINQKNIASTLLNDPRGIQQVAHELVRFKPVTIDGYSSSVYTLANYFKENNLNIKSVQRVLTTAENLEPYQQNLIEEVFAPVGDLYGSGEVLGIATKPAGDSRYYILDPHVIVETVESGIEGIYEILLTDLDNYAMPLIRYKIGDMTDAILPPEQGAKYPFRWFTKIHGRNSDIITLPSGKKFHPVNIFGGTLFRRFKGISRHKVVWNGIKLHFIFEAQNFDEKEQLNIALSELLAPYEVKFTIEYTDKIMPSGSGKYRYMEILHDKSKTE